MALAEAQIQGTSRRVAEDGRSEYGYVRGVVVAVIRDVTLPTGARVLYALLRSISGGDKDYVYTDRATLATKLGVKPDTVGRWLAELRQAQILSAKRGGTKDRRGLENRYDFLALENRYRARLGKVDELPHALLHDTSLDVGQKLHEIVLRSYGGANSDGIYPSRGTLASWEQCSVDTIDRRNEVLREAGHLDWHRGGTRRGRWGKSNRYCFTDEAYFWPEDASESTIDRDEVRLQSATDRDGMRLQSTIDRDEVRPKQEPIQLLGSEPDPRRPEPDPNPPGGGSESEEQGTLSGPRGRIKLVRVGVGQTKHVGDDTTRSNSDAPKAQQPAPAFALSPGSSPTPGPTPGSHAPRARRGSKSAKRSSPEAGTLVAYTVTEVLDHRNQYPVPAASDRSTLAARFQSRLDQGHTVEQLKEVVYWFFHYRGLGGVVTPVKLLVQELGDDDKFAWMYKKAEHRSHGSRVFTRDWTKEDWLLPRTPRVLKTEDEWLNGRVYSEERIEWEQERTARAEARAKEEAERKAQEEARLAAERAALIPVYREKHERYTVLEDKWMSERRTGIRLTDDEKAEYNELVDWLIAHPDLEPAKIMAAPAA